MPGCIATYLNWIHTYCSQLCFFFSPASLSPTKVQPSNTVLQCPHDIALSIFLTPKLGSFKLLKMHLYQSSVDKTRIHTSWPIPSSSSSKILYIKSDAIQYPFIQKVVMLGDWEQMGSAGCLLTVQADAGTLPRLQSLVSLICYLLFSPIILGNFWLPNFETDNQFGVVVKAPG